MKNEASPGRAALAEGLEAEDISFSYGKKRILEHVSFRCLPGEVCVLLGANGAGKSTLLKCVNGLLSPAGGRVRWRGRETSRLSMKQRAKIYGYVPQETGRRTELGVMETVLSGRLPYMGIKASAEDLEKTEAILAGLGLKPLAFSRLEDLSGGERQRVLIGRALAQEPEVLLLDEPTSSLDLRYQYEVMELLRKLAREKCLAVVTVLHDLNLALEFADRAVLLSGGRILAQGAPAGIEAAYGIGAEIGSFGERRVVLPKVGKITGWRL